MLLLRTLFAMFVLTMTSTAAHVVDIKFDPSLEMPPLPEEPDKFETYTIHSCLESLENARTWHSLQTKSCPTRKTSRVGEPGLE